MESETQAMEKQETTWQVEYSPTAMALVAAAEAEIKAMVGMAVKFPRDLDVVREKLLKECKRPSFAQSALYAKPVGSSKVTGLSIRFAEAAIASMGHIHTTIKTLAESDEYRKIEIRVWDAQNMVSYADEATIEKTIERRSIPKGQEFIRMRVNKSGDPLYIIRATEDDLLNKVNAAKSKSIRNSGLRMVPGWLLDECKAQIVDTTRRADAQDPDAAKKKIFDGFAELGVSVDDLKKYLGHDAAHLEPAELDDLRQLFVAVRDGETTLRAIFKQREEEAAETGESKSDKGVSALKEKLKSKAEADPLVPVKLLKDLGKATEDAGWTPMAFRSMLKDKFNLENETQIRASQYDQVMQIVQAGT